MNFARWKNWKNTLVGASLLAAAGCGGDTADVPLAQVTGIVKLDGNPIPGVLVEFNPALGWEPRTKPGTRTGSSAVSDAEGKYALQYDSERQGAVVGMHSVLVRELPNEDPAVKPRIPQRYASNSQLSYEVKPGANSYDVDIRSR